MRRLLPVAVVIAASLSMAATGVALAQTSITARGNEPSWQLKIEGDTIVFQPFEGDRIEVKAAATSAGSVDVYVASVGGQPFVVVLADGVCTDSMSGMPFPKAAVVVIGDNRFTGCGGVPAALLHGEWRISKISGVPVIAGSEPTIGFSPDGSIHGNASCNRYFGSFALNGEGLAISEAGASMMACDQPLMEQEQRVLASLEATRRFEIGATGELRLLGDNGPALIALRN